MTTKAVKLGRTELGVGRPKIAVPITGHTQEDIIAQAEKIYPEQPDIVEWRIDFFDDVTSKGLLKNAAVSLRTALKDIPILTTFRTKGEGGETLLSDQEYFDICRNILEFNQTDALDVELYHDTESVKSIVSEASEAGVVTIMSNHDFDKTPEQDDMVDRLVQMEKLGADVAKIAVMPHSTDDVLKLMSATNQAQNTLSTPVITMSMGDLGKVTRLSGEVFGSTVTFATVGAASAPGQIPLTNLRQELDDLKLN
ncbi:type I 3-dehydroquinate dehydratase [Companilactobacillus ginsenosidimutans]|uniref:3-dehydroquinate dehydratase n=1 Tax=Companilactobacillus ginsenosidimutans TaxID=1007676 RepID=A0A0H4QMJ1_9LACO|nr:type I 3-dehydroquinate dehydratase [Companilactobacillus ginsenosidimutans]AKP67903.1 3-dehydroquinate dehydratase [Companilactobacillus ginsenosidimutans]